MNKITPAQFNRMPWKNGLGYTDQIAIFPKNADLRRGDFLWRLSSARIERSSPFSIFENHDRLLVVLEGEGLRLTHKIDPEAEPEVVELTRYLPYEFLGDLPTHCELIRGPVRDLSLFFSKEHAQIATKVFETQAAEDFNVSLSGSVAYLYLMEGSLKCADVGLQAGELLEFELEREGASSDAPFSIELGPESRALLIEIVIQS